MRGGVEHNTTTNVSSRLHSVIFVGSNIFLLKTSARIELIYIFLIIIFTEKVWFSIKEMQWIVWEYKVVETVCLGTSVLWKSWRYKTTGSEATF